MMQNGFIKILSAANRFSGSRSRIAGQMIVPVFLSLKLAPKNSRKYSMFLMTVIWPARYTSWLT